ncbi:MAG: LysR substrate-binding domain-containing protein [Pseudomonadota bacterium]
MEIRQLKYFVAIVDGGSLSRAAQTLFIAQSALSKQISDLEKDLGTELLNRTRTGISATESGKIFYDHARAILKQIAEARSAVKSSDQHIVGNVAMALPQSVANALALPLNSAARQRLPGVTLQLNEELSGNIAEQLMQGTVDFAILSANLPLKAFQCQALADEELFLICGPEQEAFLGDGDIAFEELERVPLLLSSRQHDQCLRVILENEAAQRKLVIGNIAAEINSVHILKRGVLAGMGCTILPKAPVSQELERGQMSARRIGQSGLFRTLMLCASTTTPMTNPKRAVATLLIELVHELCESGQWPGAVARYDDAGALSDAGRRPA